MEEGNQVSCSSVFWSLHLCVFDSEPRLLDFLVLSQSGRSSRYNMVVCLLRTWLESQTQEPRLWVLPPDNQEKVGFPGGSDGKEAACNVEDQVWSVVGEDPLQKGMITTLVFLPGEAHGQRSLADSSPWVTKSQRQLMVTKHACIDTHTHTHARTHTQSWKGSYWFPAGSTLLSLRLRPQSSHRLVKILWVLSSPNHIPSPLCSASCCPSDLLMSTVTSWTLHSGWPLLSAVSIWSLRQPFSRGPCPLSYLYSNYIRWPLFPSMFHAFLTPRALYTMFPLCGPFLPLFYLITSLFHFNLFSFLF